MGPPCRSSSGPRAETHLIRNSLAFVSWKDRKAILPAIKAIYRAETADMALVRLEEFETEWGKRYRAIGAAWRRAWDYVVPFFAFAPGIRKMIYTTNAVEALHRSLRKIIKTGGATIEAMVHASGWQQHSVRGLAATPSGHRRAYTLVTAEGVCTLKDLLKENLRERIDLVGQYRHAARKWKHLTGQFEALGTPPGPELQQTQSSRLLNAQNNVARYGADKGGFGWTIPRKKQRPTRAST